MIVGNARLSWTAASILVLWIAVASPNSNAGNQTQNNPAIGPKKPPTFTRVLLLEESAETSANVSIGDLNGDGFPDLVLAKGRHWPLIDRVLLNDGHGRFPIAHNLGDVADRSYSVTLADLDRDGDLDVVVGNDASDPKRVYANDGKANFHLLTTFGHPEWPTRNATVADLNQDGLPDIIVANRTDDSRGSNFVCFNKGKGQFGADCLAFSHESATTITPADVNGDGLIDLIVPHRDGGQSYVYVNEGKGRFGKQIPFGPKDATIRMAQAADLNRDGRLDIVVIDERRGAFICFGQLSMSFSEPVAIGSTGLMPYALSVADLNRDGFIDVIVGNVEAPSVVYFNDGSGQRFTPVTFGDKKGTVYGFAIGDLDGDGYLDIAAARSDAPNVVYFGSKSD
ncbi:MAG TPA: VCBS repeat-containing protein [Pyrinomonadaceae bacterium]